MTLLNWLISLFFKTEYTFRKSQTLLFKVNWFFVVCLSNTCLFTACKKDLTPDQYTVNEVNLYPGIGAKDKLKSQEQYISILYTNLFQQALSGNKLVQISDCLESIGDKELGREVLISNFMNDAGVVLPTDSVMRSNPDRFISQTYERFFVRNPSEAELTWIRNFIQSNPQLTPELVYFGFALSNEYLFY
jgi:hypothetical protein